MPEISWDGDENTLYTVAFVDPDAPSRKEPKFREWLHYLVFNVKGCDLSSGEEQAAYIGSGPPQGTGLHRYVWIVYKQKEKIKVEEKKLIFSGEGRGGFNIEKWRKKYGLSDPIALNYYQAQFDSYVPTLYKKLSENKL